MRTPIKTSKKHGWGKSKLYLNERGEFRGRIKPSKKAKTMASMKVKKRKVGYRKFY